MSNPTVTCRTCGAQRNCLLHARARRPVHGAKRWLWLHCPRNAPEDCDLHYRVGLEAGLSLTGQGEEPRQ